MEGGEKVSKIQWYSYDEGQVHDKHELKFDASCRVCHLLKNAIPEKGRAFSPTRMQLGIYVNE